MLHKRKDKQNTVPYRAFRSFSVALLRDFVVSKFPVEVVVVIVVIVVDAAAAVVVVVVVFSAHRSFSFEVWH